MPSNKTIVLDADITIGIINRRTIERISDNLAPMLPTTIQVMVIIIIKPTNMTIDILRMVMVQRTALVFGIHILEYDVL